MIDKNMTLYNAIEHAIDAIFDGEIPLEDPTETTREVVKEINNYLGFTEETAEWMKI